MPWCSCARRICAPTATTWSASRIICASASRQRILRMIPGLENAEFLRFGQIHRNTYINAPALLTPTLQLRTHPQHVLRRADFGRRRLCGVDRDRACWRACTRPRSRPANRSGRSRARRRSARCAITSRRADPRELSAGQHHLRPVAAARTSAARSQSSGTPKSAAARWRPGRVRCARMSDGAHV